jgi:cold shock CspA family protein/ribosome-associated translation inhibitor RaiA
MRLPLDVTIRDFPRPAPLREEIEARAAKLDRFYDRIMRCRVTVEGPGRHHLQGRCSVRVNITVPGKEIAVTRQAGEDARAAIREAFTAAGRRIEDHVRRARRFVKVHEEPPVARVLRLFPDQGYGFLKTSDGREIYFHRNSVAGRGFARLRPAMAVRYVEEQGAEGPQATNVAPLGKS